MSSSRIVALTTPPISVLADQWERDVYRPCVHEQRDPDQRVEP